VAIPANPEAIRIKGEHMTQDEMEKPVKKDLELIRGLRDMLVEAVAQAEAIIAYYDEAEPEAEEPEAEMPMEEEAEDSAKRLSDSLKQLLASFNF
jgi:tRNA U34 5-carboxymethylaminomethyl modifying GTPase MnmE/TrmE